MHAAFGVLARGEFSRETGAYMMRPATGAVSWPGQGGASGAATLAAALQPNSARPRSAVILDFVQHPNISMLRPASLFDQCRVAKIAYDTARCKGSFFMLPDSLATGASVAGWGKQRHLRPCPCCYLAVVQRSRRLSTVLPSPSRLSRHISSRVSISTRLPCIAGVLGLISVERTREKAIASSARALMFLKKQLGASTNLKLRHKGERAFDSGTFLTIFNGVKSLEDAQVARERAIEDAARAAEDGVSRPGSTGSARSARSGGRPGSGGAGWREGQAKREGDVSPAFSASPLSRSAAGSPGGFL